MSGYEVAASKASSDKCTMQYTHYVMGRDLV
jgi:hypothetical protein